MDASALLAFLQDEPGAEAVGAQLDIGACCSAVNWSETAQKVIAAGRDWQLARALLLSYELSIEPVTVEDAELAARRWHRSSGLSIGDRLCLALAERMGAEAWTADTAWGEGEGIRQIQ